MSSENQRLHDLNKRIERLRDEHPSVKVAPPLTEQEAREIEHRHGFQFPPQFRLFLTRVCAGLSADDQYGLRTVDQTLADLELRGASSRLGGTFPFDSIDVERAWSGMKAFRAAKRRGKPDYFLSGNPGRMGVFQIFEGGPNGHFYVVLNGPQAGTIWEAPDQDLWFPTERNDTDPASQADVLAIYDSLITEHEEALDASPPKVEIPLSQKGYAFYNSPDGRLPAGIFEATHLETLHLSNNNLTSVPEQLSSLVRLTELDLSNNPLRRVPPLVRQLERLRVLNITAAGISELPDWLSSLSNLEVLRIGSNQLTRLPASLSELTTLKRLSLEHNPLEQVPDICLRSPALEAVSLKGTRISAAGIGELQRQRPSLRIVF